eukprot:7855582-Alexandrium_andersonii.AAC.1
MWASPSRIPAVPRGGVLPACSRETMHLSLRPGVALSTSTSGRAAPAQSSPLASSTTAPTSRPSRRGACARGATASHSWERPLGQVPRQRGGGRSLLVAQRLREVHRCQRTQ